MKLKELSKGTMILEKYRVLELKINTYFGAIYNAYNIYEENGYVNLYQLNNDAFRNKDFAITGENIDCFQYEGITYIAVPDTENSEAEQISLRLDSIDELFKEGISKNKYKYRMGANKEYERFYKNHTELFLKHLSSVNNLADDYFYYYCNDYEKQNIKQIADGLLKAKAFNLYTESAYRNSSYGQYMLAYCYEKGYGCECNYSLAARWYAESLKRGYHKAAIKLGDFYYEGVGIEQNYEKAIQYYLIVAANNYNVCMKLSKCYFKGIGVEQDDEKAFKYLDKAYKLGSKESYLKLAECYIKGIGVEQNLCESRNFLKKAAANRDKVFNLISNDYFSQKNSLINKIKGIGYILLSQWDIIAVTSGFIVTIIGGAIIMNLMK